MQGLQDPAEYLLSKYGGSPESVQSSTPVDLQTAAQPEVGEQSTPGPIYSNTPPQAPIKIQSPPQAPAPTDPALALYVKYHKPTPGEYVSTLARDLIVNPSHEAGAAALTGLNVVSREIAKTIEGFTHSDWGDLWRDATKHTMGILGAASEAGEPYVKPLAEGALAKIASDPEDAASLNQMLPENPAVQGSVIGKAAQMAGGLVGMGETATIGMATGMGPALSWGIAMADHGAAAQYFDTKGKGADDEQATKIWAESLGMNAVLAAAFGQWFAAAERIGAPPIGKLIIDTAAGGTAMEAQNAATNLLAKTYDPYRSIFEGAGSAGVFGAFFGLIHGIAGAVGTSKGSSEAPGALKEVGPDLSEQPEITLSGPQPVPGDASLGMPAKSLMLENTGAALPGSAQVVKEPAPPGPSSEAPRAQAEGTPPEIAPVPHPLADLPAEPLPRDGLALPKPTVAERPVDVGEGQSIAFARRTPAPGTLERFTMDPALEPHAALEDAIDSSDVAKRRETAQALGYPLDPEEQALQAHRVAGAIQEVGKTKETLPDGSVRYFSEPERAVKESPPEPPSSEAAGEKPIDTGLSRKVPPKGGTAGAINLFGPKGEPEPKDLREEGGGLDLTDKYLAARQLRENTIDKNAVVYGQDLRKATADRGEAKLARESFDFYVALKAKGEQGYGAFASKIPEAERANYDYAKSAPEGVKAVWDQMIADKDTSGLEAEQKIPDFKALENYSMQAWKPREEGESTGTGRPKFGLATPREEHRTFPTVLEGLAAGRERAMPDGLSNYARSGKQLAISIENRSYLETLKKSDVAGTEAKPGWKRIESTKLFDSADYRTPEGEAVRVSLPLWAEPKTADAINKIIADSKLKGIGPIEMAKRINNGYRSSVFLSGAFHPRQFIVREILSTPGTLKSPFKTYRDGMEAIRNWDDTTQLLAKYMPMFQPQDFTPVLEGEKGRIASALEKIPGSQAAKSAVHTLAEETKKFTFEKLGAAYKLMGARAEFAGWATRNAEALREGRVTMDDGAKAVASSYADLFGGQNWQRIGFDENGPTSKLMGDPTMRDVTGLMLNTPDWTVSKLRLFAKAFDSGDGADIRRRMWARTISRAAAATVAANFAMSLFDDKDMYERYKEAWSRGWLHTADIDWTPLHNMMFGEDAANPNTRHYFGVVGALADPVSWLFQRDKTGESFDPIKGTLKHLRYRESFIGKLVDNALSAEDPVGRAFTGAGEVTGAEDRGAYKSSGPGRMKGQPKPSLEGEFNSYKSKYQDKAGPIGFDQMPSYVLGEAMGAMPVQIQAAYGKILGQIDWSQFVGKTLGLDVAASKPPETPRPQGMPRKTFGMPRLR